MKTAYQERDAEEFIASHSELSRDLALRIYTSRLIGSETTLVLHGGGNTSVKMPVTPLSSWMIATWYPPSFSRRTVSPTDVASDTSR